MFPFVFLVIAHNFIVKGNNFLDFYFLKLLVTLSAYAQGKLDPSSHYSLF